MLYQLFNRHYLSTGISTSLAPLLVKSNDASRAGPSGVASSLVRSNDASSSWTGSACKYMNTNNYYYEIMVM